MQTWQRLVSTTLTAAGVALAAAGDAQAQQKFPAKPIRLVPGLSPGGTMDTLARITGQKMTENWGQPVVIENRPGASTVIAASLVAKSAPDGYTLMVILGSFPAAAATMPNLPYDPLKDFVGVAQFGYGTGVLTAAPALGVKSTNELIALPDVKERLQAVGFYLEPATPEEYHKILRHQIESLSQVARDAGLFAR